MTTPLNDDPVRAERLAGGEVLRLLLYRPKGNLLDGKMLAALTSAIERHAADPALKVILFEGAGPNFSFGASVAEHVRAEAPAMLRQFHGLFHLLGRLAIPTAAVVRGACLGGGCELAAWCSFVFASPDALFGQPEIKLAVLPPMASLLLPWRLGGARGLDLCVTGRTLSATEAESFGLVTEIAAEPLTACLAYLAQHLSPSSASSLRFAERAARAGLNRHFTDELPGLERLYLDELMATPDANEGIAAFLERRKPRWATGEAAS